MSKNAQSLMEPNLAWTLGCKRAQSTSNADEEDEEYRRIQPMSQPLMKNISLLRKWRKSPICSQPQPEALKGPPV